MAESEIKIKIVKGDDLDDLRNRILHFLNENSEGLNSFEILGVLDVVRHDLHESLKDEEESN